MREFKDHTMDPYFQFDKSSERFSQKKDFKKLQKMKKSIVERFIELNMSMITLSLVKSQIVYCLKIL